jgi:hypothetical protein
LSLLIFIITKELIVAISWQQYLGESERIRSVLLRGQFLYLIGADGLKLII